ncbi:MAG: hypothetical protein ACYC1L_04420 [Alphaproteobacteria bacterium]
MTEQVWAWAALAGLGAFHGINPAMGWLFAVALGLQEKRAGAVFAALVPLGLGHALSVAFVALALAALAPIVRPDVLNTVTALLLIGLGIWRLTARHRARVGMRVGFGGLTLWSFLMATGHGAGAMLLPVLLRMKMGGEGHGAHHGGHLPGVDDLGTALLAVSVHTAAMLAVAGVVAFAVFRWVGVAFLRRGWINLDLIWAGALILAGIGTVAARL